MFFSQSDHDIKCEWGLKGVEALAPVSDALIIVDVLSFTTCVDIAVSRGASVYPYQWRSESIRAFAESVGALVAGSQNAPSGYWLSPESLQGIPTGTRLILPSPNGSTLSASTGDVPTFAGCLRNAKAVAEAAMQIGKRIGVIPAGERWKDDQTLRPALEDWIGAGAIIHHLRGSRSPEAWGAAALFRDASRKGLEGVLMGCSSGRESIEKGRADDVRLAAMLKASECAPILREVHTPPSRRQVEQRTLGGQIATACR
jgi:2-phosphosulfolactate phosphatase